MSDSDGGEGSNRLATCSKIIPCVQKVGGGTGRVLRVCDGMVMSDGQIDLEKENVESLKSTLLMLHHPPVPDNSLRP